MGEYAAKARDMGVNYIGSCCGGAVATHVREMARVLGKLRGGRPGVEEGRGEGDVCLRVLRPRQQTEGVDFLSG